MDTFDYIGMARIQWGPGKNDTSQFIHFDAKTGMLEVWSNEREVSEYNGPIKEHPAVRIVFLHTPRLTP